MELALRGRGNFLQGLPHWRLRVDMPGGMEDDDEPSEPISLGGIADQTRAASE